MNAVVGSLRVNLGLDSAAFDAGVTRASRSTKRLQGEFAGLDRSARSGSGGLQNVGFQLQDLAVQIGAGTSATQALAQQLPQLLSGFGLVGIAIGTLSAVAIPLAGHFLGIGESAEDADDAMGEFARAVQQFEGHAATASKTLAELTETHGEWAQSVRQGARDLLGLDVAQIITKIDSVSEAYREQISAVIDAYLAMKDAEEALAAAEIKGPSEAAVAIAAAHAEELAAALGLSAEQVVSLNGALLRLSEAENLEERVRVASEIRDEFRRFVDDLSGAPPILQEILPAMQAIVEQGSAVNKTTEDLGGSLAEAHEHMLNMAMVDLAKAFSDAQGPAEKLVSTLDRGLGILQGWGSALGGFLESWAPNGELASMLAGAADGTEAAAALIRQREGFRSTPYEDNDGRLRVGFGSDTVTLADGSVREVTAGISVSVEDANRDLARRITQEFVPSVVSEIGADKWASLLPAQQAVLTSLAYNYGNLPNDIAAAVRDGSEAGVALAIRGHSDDNNGINSTRRQEEAAIYAAGIGVEEQALRAQTEAAREAEEQERALERARKDAEQAAEREAQLTDRAREAYDGLVASIDPAADAALRWAEAQEKVADAVARGIISAEEGQATLDAFLRHEIENSAPMQEAAAAAEQRAEEIQGIWANATDSMIDAMLDGFSGGLDDLGDIFTDAVKSMIAYALKNPVVVPVEAGGTGQPTGLGGFMQGFSQGGSDVIGGFLNGGLAGAGSALTTALGGATSGLMGLGTAIGALAGPVGLGISLFKGLMGTTEKLDEGLLVTLRGMDALVRTFETTKKTSFFGLVSSTDTDVGKAPKSISNPIQAAYDDLTGHILGLSETLGLGADAFAGFSYKFKLSLEDMTAEEKVAAVEAEFGKVSDKLARMAGVTAAMIHPGETATQALERLSASLAVTQDAGDLLNLSLFDTSIAGAAAAAAAAEAAGGLDAFASSVEVYFSNILTLQEQAAERTEAFNDALAELGISAPISTVEQFRAEVERLEAAGDPAVASLIALSDEFVAMTDAIAAANAERLSLEERLLTAQEDQAALDQRWLDSLDATNQALGEQILLQEQLNAQLAQQQELMTQVYTLQEREWALRRQQWDEVEDGNEALQLQVWLLEDWTEIQDERYALETELLQLQGDTVALRERELEELSPYNRALQEQIWALEDAKAAIDALNDADFASLYDYQATTAAMQADMAASTDAALAAVEEGSGRVEREVRRLGDMVRQLGMQLVGQSQKSVRILEGWNAVGLPPEAA